MARPTEKSVELGELIRRSEASRLQLSRSHAKLKRKLDIPAKIKNSVKSSPLKWVGGSMVTGLLGSLLFGKKKIKYREPKATKATASKGFLMGSLALMITLFKPFAKVYATALLRNFLKNQLSRGAAARAEMRNRPMY